MFFFNEKDVKERITIDGVEITIIQGRKKSRKTGHSKDDRILVLRIPNHTPPTHRALLTIVKKQYGIEETAYPRPQSAGSTYLVNALVFLQDHSVEETLEQYKVMKKTPPPRYYDFG